MSRMRKLKNYVNVKFDRFTIICYNVLQNNNDKPIAADNLLKLKKFFSNHTKKINKVDIHNEKVK